MKITDPGTRILTGLLLLFYCAVLVLLDFLIKDKEVNEHLTDALIYTGGALVGAGLVKVFRRDNKPPGDPPGNF